MPPPSTNRSSLGEILISDETPSPKNNGSTDINKLKMLLEEKI